jgi:hypothetical protein
MNSRQSFVILLGTVLGLSTVMLPEVPSLGAPLLAGTAGQVERTNATPITTAQGQFQYAGRTFPLFPVQLAVRPELPSPLRLEDGTEVVTCLEINDEFTLVPVTVENGAPLDYSRRQWAKGRQLDVDSNDFPTLAATGRHAAGELRQTKTITRRPITQITEAGQPGGLSGAGFLAPDENILSVLIGDNQTVVALGLTHRELARPLFHLWNLLLARNEAHQRQAMHRLRYRGKEVHVTWQGSRGWQESIFADEVQGMYELETWRELDAQEKTFLDQHYAQLNSAERATLAAALSRVHSGEMAPFYIQRYGFYEGHTAYRADPIAIAFIFGLKSLPELEQAFPDRLYAVLTRHFSTRTP